MDYKKKYEDALKRAKDVHTYYCDDREQLRKIESIFPELKESEDEKIRKDIKRAISVALDYSYFDKETANNCLARLENQGKEECALKSSKDEDVRKFMQYIEKEAKAYEFNLPNRGYDIYAFAKDILVWLEKQGDQKPIDNVESKFKVGDWVSNKLGESWHIDSIDTKNYQVSDGKGNYNWFPISKQDEMNLWTIADAKEGDVLAFNNDTIVIFKNLYNSSTFHSYCHIEDGIFDISKDELPDWWEGKGFQPATKEQRDLFFQRMKEAGYTFDFEKKKLNEIEDKEYNGEDYGIDSLFHAQRILEKTLGKVDGYKTDDGILSHKCAISAVNKLYRQKPAWSEEDENFFANICSIIDADRNFTESAKRRCKDWLKSLKQRIGG